MPSFASTYFLEVVSSMSFSVSKAHFEHKYLTESPVPKTLPPNVGLSTRIIRGYSCLPGVNLKTRRYYSRCAFDVHPQVKESGIDTIKSLFDGVDDYPNFSAYDMGWIARVPYNAFNTELGPQFPRSIDWIIDNQCKDGSWDQGEDDAQRVCSTLVCLIALKTWNSERLCVQRGVEFLKSSLPLVHKQLAKDTEVILSALLRDAQAINLELDYGAAYIQHIQARAQEFLLGVSDRALEQYPTSFVHVLEAFRDRTNWQHLLQFQSSSGSLFSLTLTACAYMRTGNNQCLRCLSSFLSASTKQSSESQERALLQSLRVVECIEHLGIERFFEKEIQQTLIQAFRYWRGNGAGNGNQRHLKGLKESALLFRLLRRHGYEVSPDVLQYRSGGVDKSICSQFLFPAEKRLEFSVNDLTIDQEMQFLLSFPWHSIMHRIQHVEYLTKFANNLDFVTRNHADILTLAKADFNACQAVYLEDLKQVSRWNQKCGFDRLGYARKKDVLCFFSAASTMFQPELSMARIVWAQMSVLTTVIDDFMDTNNSLDDLRNFYTAVERWDAFGLELSDDAKLLFKGLNDTIKWTAERAFPVQGRDITRNLQAQWQRLCQAFLREAEWRLTNHCPSLEEYMLNGVTSFALEPFILSAIFFLDNVDDEVLDHPDCRTMYQRVSTIGRLLNDIQGFERESAEGKVSWITIYMKENPGASVEDSVAEMRKIIDATTQELVEDLLRPRAMPKKCKLVFESVMRILKFFYRRGDGFTSDKLRSHVKSVLYTNLD